MSDIQKSDSQSKKLDFLIAYVLNRANTSHHLNGPGAAAEAIKAWNVIQKEMAEE